MKRYIITVLLALMGFSIWAAVGCDLNDPDKDVARLFPGSTGYKTSYRNLSREGGKDLLARLEGRLGDKFSGLYETMDVPYTLYSIYKGKALIGYIHGVNQKGRYGGIQIFLSLDTSGKILNMYFQKISSKNAKAYKTASFTDQFKGLNLKDFAGWEVAKAKGSGKLASIKNPATSDPDFAAIMRGVKKNLVLMQHFAGW
jgi:hypothetical protein